MPPTNDPGTNDPVCRRLLEAGIAVEPYYLFGTGGTPVGRRFVRSTHEIAYRFEPPATVLAIYYKRTEGRRGIRNPFGDFEWFLDFLAAPGSGVKRIVGMISQMGIGDSAALETSRISRFYRELLGGHTLRWEYGSEWIYKDLAEWVPRRVYRQHRQKSAEQAVD